MKRKKKQSREEQIYHARMAKQIDLYGFYQGEFLPGTELDEGLASDPKIETVIKHILKQHTKGNVDPIVVKIIKKQIKKAEAGDRKAAEFLFDRAYGKPQQTVHVNSPAPITISHSVISLTDARTLVKDSD